MLNQSITFLEKVKVHVTLAWRDLRCNTPLILLLSYILKKIRIDFHQSQYQEIQIKQS